MDKETAKFEGTLIFVAVFALLAFVSFGCASGAIAPEEAWNRTLGVRPTTGHDLISRLQMGLYNRRIHRFVRCR